MLQSEACATCGKKPPPVDTNYTLFSSKFGWRLSKHRNAAGVVHIDWLCPECWKAHKSGTVRAAAPSATVAEKDEVSVSTARPTVAAGARSREPKR
jgi:hypothetical protein